MGFWKATGKVIGHVVDLRVDRWIDLPSLKNTATFFLSEARQLFGSKKAKEAESFEEAVERLNLRPEDLSIQSHRYLLLTLFFFLLTLGLLVYTLILVYLGNWMGACVSFSLSIYASSLIFRCYFWHFQITHQKLGCSMREWYQSNPPIKRITRK